MPLEQDTSPLRPLIIITASIGIFYQVYNQTSDYLSFPSYSSIANVAVYTRLPAVTLCVGHKFAKLDRQFNFASPTILNASRSLPGYDEIINSCLLTLPNSSVVKCEDVSKPHRYMNHMVVCVSFFEKNRTHVPDHQLMYSQEDRVMDNTITPLIRVKLNMSQARLGATSMTVRPHYKPLISLRSSESKVWFDPTLDLEVSLMYRVTRRVELPPPHGSCREYPLPLDSETSIVNCWFNRFLGPDGTHLWPFFLFYDYDVNYTQQETGRKWPQKRVDDRKFPEVNRKCVQANKQIDCDREYYILYKIASRKKAKPDTQTLEIVWVPKDQLIVTNCVRTTFLEYLDQIGAILSMWIGFSIQVPFTQMNVLLQRMMAARGNNNRHSSTVTVTNNVPAATRRSDRSCHRLNNTAMRLVCWSITLYFVVQIVMIYFDKPFVISIIARIPDKLKMLQLSVCFDMIINPEKVEQHHPLLYKTVDRDKWPEVLDIEQLFETTLEWHEVFNSSSRYLSPDGRYVEISDHFNFTKSLTGRYTCFTTFGEREYRLKGEIEAHPLALISHAKSMVLKLNIRSLRRFNQSTIRMYFNEGALIDEDTSSSDHLTIIGRAEGHLFSDVYIIRTYRTLVRHFADHIMSSCWNYRDKFGSDRVTMLDRCISRNFIEKYRLWPWGHQIWRSAETGRIYAMSSTDANTYHLMNRSMEERFILESDECDRMLHKPECEKLIVKAVVQDEFFRSGEGARINLYPPSKQFFIYQQQLIYTVVDIAGYIGGTIGTWIGLSFIDLQAIVVSFSRRLCPEKRFFSCVLFLTRGHR